MNKFGILLVCLSLLTGAIIAQMSLLSGKELSLMAVVFILVVFVIGLLSLNSNMFNNIDMFNNIGNKYISYEEDEQSKLDANENSVEK